MARTLLLVDDIRSNREVLKDILGSEYNIIEAAHGQEAVAIMNSIYKQISAVLLELSMPVMDGFEVLKYMRSSDTLSQLPVIVITGQTDIDSEEKALHLGANDYISKPYHSTIIKQRIWNTINLRETAAAVNALQHDKLTGLYNREAFFEKVQEMVSAHEPGYYIMSCFDIDNFKVINDQYGTQKGDDVLCFIANTFQKGFEALGGLCCRVTADNFAVLYPAAYKDSAEIAVMHKQASIVDNLVAPITFSIGRYIVEDPSLSPNAMYDRAIMAETSIKGRYDSRIALYDKSMFDRILHQQEIVTEMESALKSGQFEIWFQPQYNHSSGAIIGAEALARWRHPKKGIIPTNQFIPVFEKNGFIYVLDKYVWEETCRYLRGWIDGGCTPPPVSVNISRYDVFRPDFIDVITGLVRKYDIPVDLLRLEITESAFAKSTQQIVSIVKQLISYGFTIEIDDFGSGYSSLNTLKSVPAQVVKLDMRFLENDDDSQRGGNILESVVRMAKWLGMAVIAEGVENKEQADFLKSIGCSYVQGYLYARAMPAAEYEVVVKGVSKEERLLTMETVENLDNKSFWDPKSMDTLIFNSYVGGACIYEYHNGNIELLRATDKYAQVIGSAGMTVEDALKLNWADHLDKDYREKLITDFETSVAAKKEVTGEYVFLDLPGCPHETYLRYAMRVIASTEDRYLVYCTNENITAQRKAEQREHMVAEQMQAIIDNVGLGITASVVQKGEVRFLFANDRYFEMLGYTKAQYYEEVTDNYDLIHPEDRVWARQEAKNAYSTQTPTRLECRFILRDGAVRWVRVGFSSTYFTSIEQNVQLCIYTDITAEKQWEQELRESDDQLRFLNETAHELLAQPDSNKGIDDALRKLLDYFGGNRAYVFEFNHEKAISNNTYEVCAEGVTSEKENLQNIPMEIMAFWINAFEQRNYIDIANVAALDDRRAVEKSVLEAQGIQSLIAVPLLREGQLLGFIGIDDPQQHSRIERLAALGDYIAVMLTRRDLNARISNDYQTLTSLMNDMPGGFCRMRVCPDGSIKSVYFNEGLYKLTGMNYDELMEIYANDALTGVHPDDVAIVNEAIAWMFEKGEVRSPRFRLRHGSGGYIWMMIFGRITKDPSGDIFLNIYYTDVEEQVKAEEIQKELLDNLPHGAALYEFNGKKLSVIHLNKRYWELVNREAVDYSEASALNAVHPDDRAFIIREIVAAIRQKRDAVCDHRILYGENEYRPFHAVARIIPKDDGRYSVYTTYTPISDEAMSYQQMLPILLSTIMESTTDLCFAKDKNYRYICASRAFANMAGLASENDVVGKTDYDLFDKELADKYQRDDEALLVSGKSIIDMVESIPSVDGVPHYSNTSKYLLRDAGGNLTGIYGLGRDITEDRTMKSQLELLANSVPGGIAVYEGSPDALDKIRLVYFSEGFCRLFGFTREEYEKMAAINPLGLVFAEDMAAMMEQVMALVQNDTPIDYIYRARINGGGFKWINVKAVRGEPRGEKMTVNAMFVDITARQEALEHLRMSEEENRLSVLHSGCIIGRYTIADRSLTMSADMAASFSLPEKVLDVPYGPVRLGIISPKSADAYIRFFEAILHGSKGETVMFQQKYRKEWRWVEAKSSTVFSDAGEPVKAVISFFDVTEQLEKEAVYKKWRQSLEQKAPESYTLFRCNISKDDSFYTMDGSLLYIDFESISLNFNERTMEYASQCVFEEDKGRYIALMNSDTLLANYYRGKRLDKLEYREKQPDGSIRWLRLSVELVEYPNSTDVEAYLMYEDINDAKQAELQTKELSETDPLTGVLNRVTLAAMVEQTIRASKSDTHHALLMLDIDGFKQINDVFGHGAGDETLIDIANALRSMLRREDLLGRLGGDEFLVFLRDIPNDSIAANKAKQICELTHKVFSRKVQISSSVGIAFVPRDGKDFETLYRKADSALYDVKGLGKGSYAFYRDNMEDEQSLPS